jgi:hypothetical protein
VGIFFAFIPFPFHTALFVAADFASIGFERYYFVIAKNYGAVAVEDRRA